MKEPFEAHYAHIILWQSCIEFIPLLYEMDAYSFLKAELMVETVPCLDLLTYTIYKVTL